MRCVIGVISSEGAAYQSMKDTWTKNASTFNESTSHDVIELYFIEAEQRSDTQLYTIDKMQDDVYLFRANCKETFKNILKKSIIFFKHMSQSDTMNAEGQFTFVMRSNLSTLIDFKKLFKSLHETDAALHKQEWEYFLGGSIIDKYCALRTYFSGTNLTFTIPVLKHIVKSYKEILDNEEDGDDIVLSAWVMGLHKTLLMRDYKRLDFCEDITFNSCDSFDESIFCFRYKTEDRTKDAELMAQHYSIMYKNMTLKEQFIHLYKQELFKFGGTVYVKNKAYVNTFTNIFYLDVYYYRDTTVVCPQLILI
jgi:hypothetical protein